MPELSITELADLIRQGLAEDERIAREACGSTVVGAPGNWRQAPGGDEWVAEQEDDFVSLLVALRPGVKRSDPEAQGLWGAVAEWQDDGDEPGVRGPMDAFVHAAQHDPATVLRDVAARRRLLDQALAWEHVEHEDEWHSCNAHPARTSRWPGQPPTFCTCGRDERVLAVLQTLATPYQETT